MAAVDALLRLIVVRNAELPVVAAGQVPVLRRAGETQALSMPPLDASLVAAMVGEVLDEAAQQRLTTTSAVEARYELGDGSAFALLVERRDEGYRIACRPAPPAPRPPAPPRAATPAAPVPPLASTPAPLPRAPRPPHELESMLHRAVHQRASDLLLSCGQAPRLRIGGELVVADAAPLGDDDILALLAPVLDDAAHAELERTGSTDVALDLGDGAPRFRVNLFRQRAGLAAALRPIRREPPTLDELNLPADLHDLARYPSGLVVFTGRAGSGKSTTLAALIAELDRTRSKHIITLEDPIEYEYRSRRCLIHQREVGAQLDSFAAGLRAALRESPDIILVGEMRDRETIAAALTAAETGHLVLSTMHTASAAGAIDRIIDVFPEHQQQQVRLQLALALRAVVTQVLVPGITPPARFPAYEKMIVTSAVAAQIRDGKVHQIPTLIQTGRDAGMVPLDRTLAALVRTGKVTAAAARDAGGSGSASVLDG